MATVKNAITLQDRMTPVLSKVMKAMNSSMKVMESMNRATNNVGNSKAFSKMQKDVQAADNAVKKFNNDIIQIPPSQEKVRKGFSGWQAGIVSANQALQLGQQIAGKFNDFANTADEYNNINARLALINDGKQTQLRLEEKVYQAAQRSRGAYNDTAETVAKLGLLAQDAFSSNDELIAFSETINKAFVVSGAGAQEMQGAMRQLSQAMASGRLQGDELVSIMENAPMVYDAIAKYMGLSKGKLKELSREGAITADIIKAAVFNASDDINAKFKEMPMSWAQATTMMKNYGQKAFAPLMKQFSQFLSSDTFQRMADGVSKAIQFVANSIQFVADNWQYIKPILIVGLTILAAYFITTGLSAFAAGMMAAAAWLAANWQILLIVVAIGFVIYAFKNLGTAGKVIAAVIMLIVAAYAIWTVAQWALNGAVLANPIVWILIAVIAAIGLVIMALVLLSKYASEIFAFIGGVIYAAGAVFSNVGRGIANAGLAVAEFFINCWNDAVYDVQMAWYNLKIGVLTIISAIVKGTQSMINTMLEGISSLINGAISGINTLIGMANNIPGVNISAIGEVSFQTKGNWAAGIDAAMANTEVPVKKAAANLGRFEYKDVGAAYDKGSAKGAQTGAKVEKGLADLKGKISNSVSGLKDSLTGAGAINGTGGYDNTGGGAGKVSGGKLDEVGKIGSDISLSDEDLKYMRDVAKVDYINKYTTLRPNMNVSFGDVRETADVNKIMGAIEDLTEQALQSVLVGT